MVGTDSTSKSMKKIVCRMFLFDRQLLFNNRFLPLLQECPKNELKEIADTLKATKELMLKVNSLRQQAGLSAIEN
ncbi:hypothetical protein [Faecalibacterium sp.]|uniref:hypothetical protein n=1 Tax=Faecalibacterium sp. TaxID=1971605 RepID=UPI003994DADF